MQDRWHRVAQEEWQAFLAAGRRFFWISRFIAYAAPMILLSTWIAWKVEGSITPGPSPLAWTLGCTAGLLALLAATRTVPGTASRGASNKPAKRDLFAVLIRLIPETAGQALVAGALVGLLFLQREGFGIAYAILLVVESLRLLVLVKTAKQGERSPSTDTESTRTNGNSE